MAADRARVLLFAWLALVFVDLELFLVFDWGQGPARTALLALLALLLVACRRWAHRVATLATSSRGAARAARIVLFVGIVANVGPWLYFVVDVARTGTLHSDQGQTVEDGLQVLREDINPYGAATVTDSFAYGLAMEALAATPSCRATQAQANFRVGRADDTVVPRIAQGADCEELRLLFASLGFKYGPATLLFYLPFVAAFGPPGFLVSHLALVAACAALIYRRAVLDTGSWVWGALVLCPLLWPTPLAWNVLAMENVDIFPVVLATLAYLACTRGRYGLAALCIGVSAAAKFLPALLFLPLLARGPRRYWAVPFVVLVAAFAPFAAWDRTGLVNNVLYPFTRPPDSTALAFFLPPLVRTVVRGAAGIGVAALAVRAHRLAWDASSGLEYLLFAHLLLLAVGTAFHNNYLVWLLPLVSLYLLEQIRRAGAARAPSAADLVAAPLAVAAA